jgi:hypothetical protein
LHDDGIERRFGAAVDERRRRDDDGVDD